MARPPAGDPSERWLELVRAALARSGAPGAAVPDRLIVVDVAAQKLALLEQGQPAREYRVSTSAIGVGGASGSNRTPPGWHRIHARIGAEAPLGLEFRSRVPTGRIWSGEPSDEDMILTRILTLDGLEPGVNRGGGCDSLERFIYLHGTNQERTLGTPASHGCVRMANPDIVEVFKRVKVGTEVVVE